MAARDTDTDVETVAGKTVADVFLEDGEPHFRVLEREAVTQALAVHEGCSPSGRSRARRVHAGGPGVLLRSRGRRGLPRRLPGPRRAPGRVQSGAPLLLGNPRAKWQALMDGRRPVYERLATLRVLTDGHTPGQVAQEIEAALGDVPSGARADTTRSET
ncbi:shikimate kinase [Oerskovia sp. M15]